MRVLGSQGCNVGPDIGRLIGHEVAAEILEGRGRRVREDLLEEGVDKVVA
jgi:hypothetical protein